MAKILKKVLVSIPVAMLLYVVWWCGMNYTGYCHAQGRYLSDQEKIDSAVRFVLRSYPPSIEKQIVSNHNGMMEKHDVFYVPDHPIKYDGVGDFFERNPSCCKLSEYAGESGRASLIDRVTGYVSTYVVVKYKVMFIENNEDKYAIDNAVVAVKNCGGSWSGL